MFTIISLATSFIVRFIAIQLVSAQFVYKVEKSEALMLTILSTFLGLLMPAQTLDFVGGAFRLFVFALIAMVILRIDLVKGAKIGVGAAIIHFFFVIVLSATPLNFLVQGLSSLTIP